MLDQRDITMLMGCKAETFYEKVNDGLMDELGVDGCYVWEDPIKGEIYAVGTSDTKMNVKGYTPGGSFEEYMKELVMNGWELTGIEYWCTSGNDDEGVLLKSALFDKDKEEIVLSLLSSEEDKIYSIEYVDTEREKNIEKGVYGEAEETPAFMVMTRLEEVSE